MECRAAGENRFGKLSDTTNCREMRFWVRVTRCYFFLLFAADLSISKKLTSGSAQQGRISSANCEEMCLFAQDYDEVTRFINKNRLTDKKLS